MNIDDILNGIYPLPPGAKGRLVPCFAEVARPKGTLLMKAGRVERNMYFIQRGIVRAYTHTEDREITFWFGREGDTVLSMKSYVDGEKPYENIELLEDCVLYEANIKDLKALFNEDLHIANWGRRLAEAELVKTEERLISRQVKTASQRYEELLRNYPYLVARVSLGHIASYLGITGVSLSRIRSERR